MALKILHVGVRNSVLTLDADAFTRRNFKTPAEDANWSSRTSAATPNGVLGGSVACLKGEGASGAPDDTLTAPEPVGLFLNDAAGNSYENTPTVASNKNTHLSGMGAVAAVDLYETKSTAGAALTYAFGDKLYCSANGFLTKEAPSVGNGFNETQVAMVLKAPAGNDPYMTVVLKV